MAGTEDGEEQTSEKNVRGNEDKNDEEEKI